MFDCTSYDWTPSGEPSRSATRSHYWLNITIAIFGSLAVAALAFAASGPPPSGPIVIAEVLLLHID
jgi:hypothetical protein